MNRLLQLFATVAVTVGCDASRAAHRSAVLDGHEAQPTARQPKTVPVTTVFPGTQWAEATPESQGVDEAWNGFLRKVAESLKGTDQP